jgi:acetyltransferase-like isoleucine patch superfamily enzyme
MGATSSEQPVGQRSGLRLYLSRQASSLSRYVWEQSILALFGWIPTVIGIAVRAALYRLIMHMDGLVAIEKGVRIRFADQVRLGRGVYLDEGVYLHACPGGIRIGDNTLIMHRAELHVYNFRNLPHAGIEVGRDCLIGEFNVLRGQGGIHIGNRVYTSPFVQLAAVNHVFADPTRPFVEQGITAQGITVEDDVWIGAGAIITDGVCIGRGAVVAAGAVVTGDVQAHTVVAGVPARVVKTITGDPPPTEVPVYL